MARILGKGSAMNINTVPLWRDNGARTVLGWKYLLSVHLPDPSGQG